MYLAGRLPRHVYRIACSRKDLANTVATVAQGKGTNESKDGNEKPKKHVQDKYRLMEPFPSCASALSALTDLIFSTLTNCRDILFLPGQSSSKHYKCAVEDHDRICTYQSLI